MTDLIEKVAKLIGGRGAYPYTDDARAAIAVVLRDFRGCCHPTSVGAKWISDYARENGIELNDDRSARPEPR